MTYLLGIDIGTSACKTALFGPDGQAAASVSAEYPVHRPQPGWAEQNPDDWWAGVVRALRTLLASVNPADIAGIGVGGQSWSAVLVDSAGQTLANTPIWMDTRAWEACGYMERAVGADRLFDVCGNPLMPTYTLPKLLWYRAHRPEAYDRAARLLQSNSFIVYRLTGMLTQDASQGYGLQCYNMRTGVWDLDILRALGVRASLLPDILECAQVAGRVTPAAARATGLLAGTPVVAGGLDAACGSLGAGVYRAGQTQEQGGQAGGMSICIDQYAADRRLILSRHVVPGCCLLQGGTVGGGGVLRWLRETLCPADSFEALGKEAEQAPPGSDGVVFLPYMAGERSPIWNPSAKGVFFGLDYAKGRGHIIRAAMEGVAYALRHNLEVAAAAGAVVGAMYAMGGSANSRCWTQIKADVTGRRIEVPASDTATTLGAALLAGVGTGVYAGFAEAVRDSVRVGRAHEPDARHAAVYESGYAVYRQLYERLCPLMNA